MLPKNLQHEVLPSIEHEGKTYVVEKYEPDVCLRVRYILREASGARGERYGLIESSIAEGLFFATNMSNFISPTPFDGFRMMEKAGRLVAVPLVLDLNALKE